MQRVRRQQEGQFERAAIRYFKGQEGRIAESLGTKEKAEQDIWGTLGDLVPEYELEDGVFIRLDEAEKADKINLFVLSLLDWNGEQRLMETMFMPLWKDTYNQGTNIALAAYRLQAIKKPELVDFARLQGSTRIKRIEETTRDSIRKIISTGIEEGHTRALMSRKIVQEMNTSEGRARTIAQTETHVSLMTGNSEMMKAGGIKKKMWLTAADGAVRSSHQKLNGLTIPIDAKFPNGLRFPGDPECNNPAEVINCRCDLVAGDY